MEGMFMLRRPILMVILLCVFAGSAPLQGQDDFLPMAVWYGGGKARAPMLEPEPLKKKDAWRKDLQQIKTLGFNSVRCWIDWAREASDV